MGARSATRRYDRLDDTRLAALVRAGDDGAFEAIYERHHAPLLSFCRHMLGSLQDGEDVLQQTFLRAHRALRERPAPDSMRPWLFAIARNRCLTLLAARRESVAALEDHEPSFDGLAEDVARRADLRELVGDLARLPDEQREALVLFELGGSSQVEIGRVLGCPPAKVKALVFQARTTLIAERDARSTPCDAIREQLAVARGGVLRRGSLRRHLRECAPCDAYRLVVAEQRDRLGLLLPVLPSAGLKAAILAGAGLSGGGSAAAAAGGAVSLGGAAVGGGTVSAGGFAATALVAKVAVTVAVAGAGVSGAVAAVHSGRSPAAPEVRAVAAAPTRAPKPTRPASTPTSRTATRPVSAPTTPAPDTTTPRRRVLRRHVLRRIHRAALRRRRVARRARLAAIAPRRAARREARQTVRRDLRQRARRDVRPGAVRPNTPRPGRPRRAAPGRTAVPRPRPLRPRPLRPAPTPTPAATPTPAVSAAPSPAPTP
jgi:RNA polymerase sigma factor (sigma-70 family)